MTTNHFEARTAAPRSHVEPLSARLSRLRIARGYSVYELAAEARVFAGTLKRLEAGIPADKRVLAPVARALRLPLCQVVCGEHSWRERACVVSVAGDDGPEALRRPLLIAA